MAVRNIRRDYMDKLKALKKESGVSEDEIKDGEKKLQVSVDKFCKVIDEIAAAKEKEIMEI